MPSSQETRQGFKKSLNVNNTDLEGLDSVKNIDLLPDLLQSITQTPQTRELVTGLAIAYSNLSRVTAIVAYSPYCEIIVERYGRKEVYPVRTTMTELHQHLRNTPLRRIHNSYMVDLKRVCSIQRKGRNWVAIVNEEVSFPVGPSYLHSLREEVPHLFHEKFLSRLLKRVNKQSLVSRV